MQYRTIAAFWDGPTLYEVGTVAAFPESIGAALVRSGKVQGITAPPAPVTEPKPEPKPRRTSRRSE